MTTLKEIDAKLLELRHHLQSYRGFVSPADKKDGYPLPSDIKKQIKELEARRRKLLREARRTSV